MLSFEPWGGRATKVIALRMFRDTPLRPFPVIIAPIILNGKKPPMPNIVPYRIPPSIPKIIKAMKQRMKAMSLFVI